MPDLREKVTGLIELSLGYELREVWYNCLKGETDGTDLADPDLFIGGEVELRFNEIGDFVISWDENAGWDSHFSLVVTGASVFLPDTLKAWSVAQLYPWSEVIGRRLRNACVYGYDESPHIVELSFERRKSIYVGVGYQQKFGDGDDLLIRSSDHMIDLSDWDLLWSR